MSAGGHAVRRLKSNPATPGNAVVLSIDIRLQAMVEELFGDRRGALVAIDPSNGEILAFVSKPNFDPNLFVDGIDVENWRALNESPDKPLLNRALRGTYPPGSTYKPFMALAALTLGKRTPQQTIFDPGYFNFGNHRFRDDKEGGHGTVDMYKSIVQSCDTYYYMLANDLGVDAMHDFMAPLGFGQHHRHRPAGRAARHAAVDRVEAQRLPEEGSAEVVRRRDDLARHRPGLQHASRCCSWRRPRRRSRPAASASRRTWCARSRTTRRAPRAPLAFPRAAGAGLEARARRLHPQRALRRDAGRHVGALVRQRAVQVGRQDRHRAGDRDQGEREVQRRRASTSAIATTRSTPPSRRSSSRASRSRSWSRTPASAPAPRRRSRAASSTTCSPASTRARPTSRRRSSASRRRRSARRGRSTSVPLPGATVDGAATARAEPAAAAASRVGAGAGAADAAAPAREQVALRPQTAMSAVFDSPSLWQRARPVFTGFDVPLVARRRACSRVAGLVTMYSAGFDHGTRFVDHGRNMALAFVVLFLAAQIPPQQLMRWRSRSTSSA